LRFDLVHKVTRDEKRIRQLCEQSPAQDGQKSHDDEQGGKHASTLAAPAIL
jgi:hypothetical protein